MNRKDFLFHTQDLQAMTGNSTLKNKSLARTIQKLNHIAILLQKVSIFMNTGQPVGSMVLSIQALVIVNHLTTCS